MPRQTDEVLLADYEQTVGVITQLTDVRFKLAAFVPTLTAAAAALLGASDVEPLERAALAAGGLVFILGIITYDLRNSQLYNSAMGRAEELEKCLFQPFGGDTNAGVFGSRRDTTVNVADSKRDRFNLLGRRFSIPVRHGPALSAVYAAAVAVWVWVLFDAGAGAVRGWTDDVTAEWQLRLHDYVGVIPVFIAVLAAVKFHHEHRRHDQRSPSGRGGTGGSEQHE